VTTDLAMEIPLQKKTIPRYRIKLQKFDGTGSWESWWAHFQNCASYNRWTKHDKLAFMKGALIGNAAQVLWDTDQRMTGSLRKLVATLKSRYSGERQAEEYRAELQIRRRRSQEKKYRSSPGHPKINGFGISPTYRRSPRGDCL